MSTYLEQLKGAPSPFEGDGFKVMLRPLLFGERQEIIRFIEEEKGKPGFAETLERKLVALALVDGLGERTFKDESEIDGKMAGEIVDAIAFEVSYRAGINKRPDEKKALPPSTSTTPETNSDSTSHSPAG